MELSLRASRVAAGLVLLALTAAAGAHGLRVSVQAEADGLRGQALYADGTPARAAQVSLYADASPQPLAQARADGDGRFRLPLAAAGRYRVGVASSPGHRAEATLAWAPVDAAPAAPGAAQIAALLRDELAPLREDIARLHARTRLAEAVGGTGLLVGLFGAFAWWRARRRG